ncbi:CDP-alcohol phosphatidyltransferase family protein [Phreatobacter sp. AB_2022a]|uniref:CDP-alcohol phosphatidyltransferase family protein n=1 Tax=Phreatobacter sp. AB_2022a TaxID=3003134 RepID=UPI0022871D0B|nr:CDP-alcohol phosphatidyltransferase family protein [Phreatobacter sp. AB_2022a]MCZ0734227.1 CDP-alcohol phosphatidyltransferase family protein [Phreatobacter sp. AB_2022a]
MTDESPLAGDRRPLSSRDSAWAQAIARTLSSQTITPNQISQASVIAAFLAGGAFWLAGQTGGLGRALLLATAALFCQLRLLCNLFDGMVAMEGGKAEPDGPFWNEFPDRVADILILAGLGFGANAPALGLAAAAAAILTAYVRELGRACGAPSDFSGPMAKQHRMAVVTAAAVLSIPSVLWGWHDEIPRAALWTVAIGAAVTALRRSWRLVHWLKSRAG